ncbi:hypothetical protein NST83_24855 [Paenibacillus sp. FSL R10-2782]|uniref:hypothetical protein n=1 Tax=Paenibacillus sp. FSL R10-2782 TaxID=2954661 RepID=UPI0031594720
MRFYENKIVQIIIAILYPIAAFVIFSNGRLIGSWTIPAILAILFCFLWKDLRYLAISNVLMWFVSVPMWWLFVERMREDQGPAIFISSLPFIVLSHVFIVLIPQILIVLCKNVFLKKAYPPHHGVRDP